MSSGRIGENEKIISSGMSARDFFAEAGYEAAPIGGHNPFSMDSTQVLNLPHCPGDCACKGEGQMVAKWVPRGNMEIARRLGIIPIPSYMFDDGFNGGKPVAPVWANRLLRDGVMLGDPGTHEVVLCFTTCQREAELAQNSANNVERMMNGGSSRMTGVSTQAAVGAEDAVLRQGGLTPEEDASYSKQTIERTGKGQFVAKERRPMVSVPG